MIYIIKKYDFELAVKSGGLFVFLYTLILLSFKQFLQSQNASPANNYL
jgi:hypothetical protein